MKTYEELVELLKIEKQEWEKSILKRWIERDGLEEVNKEIENILIEIRK